MIIERLRITITPGIYGNAEIIGLDVDVETDGKPMFRVRQTMSGDDFMTMFESMMEIAKTRIIQEFQDKQEQNNGS